MATATQRTRSPIDKNMLDAGETSTPVMGTAPGTDNKGDITFDDLGNLSDFKVITSELEPGEGMGEYMTVLADFVTGDAEETFIKGDVRRLSRIVGQVSDTVSLDLIKSRIKRLFVAGAIRKATSDEAGMGHVEIVPENETAAVISERSKRVVLEQENEILRRRLAEAQMAQTAATPGKAGVSEAATQAAKDAQTETAKATAGTDETWED